MLTCLFGRTCFTTGIPSKKLLYRPLELNKPTQLIYWSGKFKSNSCNKIMNSTYFKYIIEYKVIERIGQNHSTNLHLP